VPIVYDPADYPAAFDRLLRALGYERVAREPEIAAAASPRPIGIGLSAYLEGTGIGPFEGATCASIRAATIFLQIGVVVAGPGARDHARAVCAAELGVDTEQVVVVAATPPCRLRSTARSRAASPR
jgi:carbon-monoxide dehydrogenase large subunit